MYNAKNGKNNNKSIVIFEQIGFFSIPLVFLYLWRNYKVIFLEIAPNLEKNNIFKKKFVSGQIKRISFFDYDLISLYHLNNKLIADIERIYEDEVKNSLEIFLERWIKTPHIHAVYKKALCYKLITLYRMDYILTTLHATEKKEIIFIPDEIYYTFKQYPFGKNVFNQGFITIPFWAKVSCSFLTGIQKLFSLIIIVLLPLWILFQIGIPSIKKRERKHYQVGIRVSSDDWALNNRYRSFDFLIDGKCLNNENTLFCIEEKIPDQYREKLKERKYCTVELKKSLKGSDFSFIFKNIIGNFGPAWINILVRTLGQSSFITMLTAEIFYKYLIWSKFLDNYHLNHYVSYNEYLPADIVRFITFDQDNTQTWFYNHSCGTFDFITPQDQEEIFDYLFIYYSYHHFIVWGQKMESYYRKHPHFIRNFDRLGCFWSEHAMLAKNNKSSSELNLLVKRKFSKNEVKHPQKIIGVFDTSFTETCPYGYEDMAQFVDGIFKLLDDFPDICVVFKNKKTLDFLSGWEPRILHYYKKIWLHPRCFFTGEEFTDPSETTGISDLVISAPFTSPTIEALGSRTRAIYYDATGKFQGCYYDHIPNLVAHNYLELKELVTYWLFKNTEPEFDAFLETYIKGELDEFVDGKAITRFRVCLST